jgi:zinc/manganese transport system substrate-binding protein
LNESPSHSPSRRRLSAAALAAATTVALAACGSAAASTTSAGPTAHTTSAGSTTAHAASTPIVAVGAENEYADVISQIGGKYVQTTAIESNPNTDPHTFEASPSVAHTVSEAKLIVQNGLGYDDYMTQIEKASPSSGRQVIDVQKLLGLPDSTRNPHLWYDPKTMPAVAAALVKSLSALDPSQKSYFAANAKKFDASLKPWTNALAAFKKAYPSAPVATTEPVGDYMLEAAGTSNKTPWTLQADIMNGVDPSPQDITLQNGLLANHKVKVFVYNQQVTDSITQQFLATAQKGHVPVVGVYETMPIGYHYQSWMMAELNALKKAVTRGVSTTKL